MLARALALALLLVGPAHAFRVAYRLPGGSEFQGFAVAWPHVFVADSVDGDLVDEDPGGVVSVYDARTGTLLWKLRDPETPFGAFGYAFAASGQWVAARNGLTGPVHVFDNAGRFVRTVRAPPPEVSRFGDRLALGGDFLFVREMLHSTFDHDARNLIHAFDVKTGVLLHTVAGGRGVGDFGDVMVVANGDTLIVAAPRHEVVCAYHARSGVERWCTTSPRRYDGDLFGYALSAYGNDLLVGAPGGHRLEFGNAYLLDVQTGEMRRKYHGPGRGSGFGSAVAIQGHRLLVGAPDWYERAEPRGKTYLLDKRTGRVLHTFRPLRAKGIEYTGGTVAFVVFRPVVVDEPVDTEAPPIIRVFR